VTYPELALVNYCDTGIKAKRGSVVYIPSFYGQPASKEEQPKVQLARVAKREESVARVEAQKELPAEPKPVARAQKKEAKAYHIVRKGERLADISEKYGVDVATLKQINRLKKGQIYPNMRIQLVSEKKVVSDKKAQPKIARTFHTVKKGENLSDISEKYGVNVITLKRVNKLKSNRILAGMRLRLPEKKG
jgi:LysM repeat protein